MGFRKARLAIDLGNPQSRAFWTKNGFALTGESRPRTVRPGDEVISGCVNADGVLRIRTTKIYGESTVAKILDLVENSSLKKAPVENFITKFARYYTPAVCIGALVLAVVPPLLQGNWLDWIMRALTFLVISCPCALVISVFGIMGVLNDAGLLDYLADSILQSKAASTERGAELICMLGISLTTILFGGVTSASILTFGPILNRIGSAKNIHPYRRANLLDGTANSLPAIVPFMSVFVFIGAALTGLSPVEVAGGTVYAFALFGTFLVAVITGWGRKHEDEPAKK